MRGMIPSKQKKKRRVKAKKLTSQQLDGLEAS